MLVSLASMNDVQFQLVYDILSAPIGFRERWIFPVGPQHLVVPNGVYERCAFPVGPQHLVVLKGFHARWAVPVGLQLVLSLATGP